MTPLREITDQLGRRVRCPLRPRRIVSLVPSQTELLADLDLTDEVVGLTKFCIHPENWFRHKTQVGGTKQLHFDRIEALRPDLIIANKEENRREDVEQLAERYPVWVSDVRTPASAFELIERLGAVCDRSVQAEALLSRLKTEFTDLPDFQGRSAAYLIWFEPLMAVAADTFIDSMLSAIGLRNAFADRARYPVVTLEELSRRRPDYLFLSSEPFPFRDKHYRFFAEALPATTTIVPVDGELFSWYGSRLLRFPDYAHQLHRSLFAIG